MSCITCKYRETCASAFGEHSPMCGAYDKNKEAIEVCDIRMERQVNQILWGEVMGDLGHNWDRTYANDTFEVRAYDWADADDDSNAWHFWHKPSGFKLEWYKYPLRSPYANMNITHEQFLNILYDCHNSMQEGKRCRVLYGVVKWWEGDGFDEDEV